MSDSDVKTDEPSGNERHRQSSTAVRIVSAVERRWPTLLALAMSAATFGGSDSDDGVTGLGEALLLLPLLYLIVAAARQRRASWPVLVALLATMVALRQQDVVSPAVPLVVLALGLLLWGEVQGYMRKPGQLRMQALGMVGFGAIVLVGLAADPDLGRYILAAGWFGHGLWDFAHLRADTVVSRSFAEWCAVIDILIAIQLAFRL